MPIFHITEFPDLGEGGIENPRLTNGRHNIIKCSACGTPLVDAWVTEPDVQSTAEIVAHCCMCGDKSFRTRVSGGFHLGVASDKVDIDNIEMTDVITIRTIKK